MSQKPNKDLDYETTGHTWDGIQEYNKPLPRWWLWTFYATIVWGIAYTIAYPAWPGLREATAGVLGYSTRGEVAQDIAAAEARNAEINGRLSEVALTEIAADAQLHDYAVSSGAAVFKTWCAQCHGAGAAGAKGYPNLLDNDWLWGGDMEAIYATVRHGIRSETDDDTRYSEMPAFGRDELLSRDEIDQVTHYVVSLSAPAIDPVSAEAGAVLYADNCASCHGEEALGDREQGAPNLADAIWLYGDDFETIRDSIYNARFGVMPEWQTRLSEAQVRAVSAYVHQLGGGE